MTNTLNRRSMLRATLIGTSAMLSTAAVAATAAPAFPFADPHDAAGPVDLAERVASLHAELKAAARELWPDAKVHDHGCSDGFALIVMTPPPPVQWDGPGIYEFKLLRKKTSWGSHPTPVAYLDREPRRDSVFSGRAFYWRHYHKGKFFSRRSYLAEGDFQIVRKREAFD